MEVSKYFTLAQLTATQQKTSNKPPQSVLAELTVLGSVLDEIYEKIGPFKVESAYRSQETQEALKSGGNVQAISKSYHTLGMAADIVPSKEGISSFFFKILGHPTISKKVGGVAIKSNTIHFDTDIKKRVGVGLRVTSSGAYVRLSDSEVKTGIAKYVKTAAIAGGGLLAILAAIGAFFFFKRKK